MLVCSAHPTDVPPRAPWLTALERSGLPVTALTLERATGGRAQLYRATLGDGSSAFVKVYGRDSRDADLLYRSYRMLVLRDPGDEWLGASMERAVEHEGLLLLLARRAGVRCPDLRAMVSLPDGSMVLAMEDVGDVRSTRSRRDVTDELLDAVWARDASLHDAGIAHRALRGREHASSTTSGPVIVDFGSAEAAATPRCRRSTAAELIVSLADARRRRRRPPPPPPACRPARPISPPPRRSCSRWR